MTSSENLVSSSTPRLGLKTSVPRERLDELKRRMASYLQTLFGIAMIVAVTGTLAAAALHAPMLWALIQFGIAAAIATMWAVTRSKACNAWVLSAIDVVGVRAICIAYAAAPLLLERNPALEYSALIPVAFVLLIRAAVLPSTPARTIVIGAPALVPVILVTWLLSGRPATSPALSSPWIPVLNITMWSALTVVATVIVSKTVFGLEERIREVMQLGQYVLESKLGEGGMGVVYKGRHALLRRPTAVKLLQPDRASAQDIARFEREVRIASELSHPNTVAIYDFGRTPEGVFYYAMEYLRGLTLEQLVRQYGPQPPARVVALLTQICAALSEAHGLGLVHRDIKPANIMVCNRGGVPDTIKVLDYGLVKSTRSIEGQAELSSVGQVLGTPLYMAPEAVKEPESVDARADLYALGAVGFFLLTGRPVFQGKVAAEVIGHHLFTPAPSVRSSGAPETPPQLDAVLLRCLEKEPGARFKSASDLSASLQECGCPAWSRDAAALWWANHEASAAKQSPIPSSAAAMESTLAVDLRERTQQVA